MAAGDELRIGKTAANTEIYGMGMEGAGIGSSPVTLPNTDYNSFRPFKMFVDLSCFYFSHSLSFVIDLMDVNLMVSLLESDLNFHY